MNQIRRVASLGAAFALFVALAGGPRVVTAQGTPLPDFLVTVRSAHDFDQTLALLRQAIEVENLMVVDEINPQQMLRMVGVRVSGMRQIVFFHPRYMKQILETNRNGGIEPPLKVLVMEQPDGGRRIGIVALARRLLVELWRYLETGAIPEGAVLTT